MSRSRASSPSTDRALIVGLTLACALAMLYLAVPRTIAAFLALPGGKAVARLTNGEAVEAAPLAELARAHRRAARWVDDAKLRTRRGQARLQAALDRPPGAPVDNALLDEAIEAYREGLARAPGTRDAWARLALAQLLRDGPSPEVATAVRMSLLTGFYDRRIMFLRLELAFRVWRYFDAQDRALIFRQVYAAWKWSPKRLLEVADRPMRLGIVRAALAARPGELERLELVRRRIRDRDAALARKRAPRAAAPPGGGRPGS